ncbi:HBR557Cp [Eremothecium sinecaudum]|uniref:Autophagy-related protein 2 n=1 Tax=Eremothecium sinecaudum TaxID=45286 RepID=A0A109UXQ0_9SACH|nr:HBR557Cp [Eremothecium sinecaudum]AMD19458.1 HBR557Cp [Eremothecium sinecaudum]
MASWLPQHIQKKLLLYVLQQMSIFSHVDVSNLDVSLGRQSHFAFRDLKLDIDSISIPNLSVTSGHISELNLKLAVAGGLDIVGGGLKLEAKLEVNNIPSPNDIAATLAKSVIDLTNSMMLPLDDSNDEEDDAVTNSGSDGGETSTGSPTPSTLSAMRNKALVLALSNLSLRLSRTVLSLSFSDELTIDVFIENIEYSTIDSKGHINIQGIKVTLMEKQSLVDEETLSTSFDASLYMSAMDSLSRSKVSGSEMLNKEPVTLCKVDSIKLLFEGVTSTDDLRIKDIVMSIGAVDIFFDAMLEINRIIIETILEIISLLQKSDMDPKPSTRLHSYQRFKEEQEIEEPSTFTQLHLAFCNIVLPKGITLQINKLDFKNSLNDHSTIALQSIYLKEHGRNLLTSDNYTKPLIIFTANDVQNENRIIINSNITITITEGLIDGLLYTYNDLQSILKAWNKFKKPSALVVHEQFTIIKSKDLIFDFPLTEYKLRVKVSPVKVELSSLSLSTDLIVVNLGKGSKHVDIAEFNNFVIGKPNNAQFEAYDIKFTEILLTSKIKGTISNIDIKCSEDELKNVLADLTPYLDRVKLQMASATEKRQAFMNKSVRIMSASSFSHRKSIISDMVLVIEDVSVNFSTSSKSVGELSLKLKSSVVTFNSDNTIVFHSLSVGVSRRHMGKAQKVLDPIRATNAIKPAFILQLTDKDKTKVNFRNICFYYYARWLDTLENADNDNSKHTKVSNGGPLGRLEVKLFDCAFLMNPYNLNTALLICINRCIVDIQFPSVNTKVILRSPTLMLIDDRSNMKLNAAEPWSSVPLYFSKIGFTTIGKANSISTTLTKQEELTRLDIDVDRIDLSLCADSFQCFVQTLIDLRPPVSFPDVMKYRTEVPPVNVMDDVDEEFFTSKHLPAVNNLQFDTMNIVDNFIDNQAGSFTTVPVPEESEQSSPVGEEPPINIEERYFEKPISPPHTELPNEEAEVLLDVNLNVHKAIVKLHDGYDWIYTRKTISDVVHDMEDEVHKQKEPTRIEANLFDSVFLYAASNTNMKKVVTDNIQSDSCDDQKQSTSRIKLRPSVSHKVLIDISGLNLRFCTFKADEPTEQDTDWSADILNTCAIEVETFEVIDNVPTSTWNKFITRLKEGHKNDTAMLSLYITLVRPIDFLKSTELITTAKIAPLRLHVDQDTLDFLIRFGEFKDQRFELIYQYPDIVYVQRFEVHSIDIRLDYKPKKIDFVGLRSGHTSELMNLFTLEGAKLTLKRVVLYGIELADLNACLNGIWTPDVKRSQLPRVLKGVTPLKSIITLGSGVKALVTVPIKEYQHDQRLSRSIQKGAQDFIKTTSGELLRLGVRMASGTQIILEYTEELLGGQGHRARGPRTAYIYDEQSSPIYKEDTDLFRSPRRNQTPSDQSETSEEDFERVNVISLYADQPANVQSGVKDAYGSLGKNFNIAYGAMRKAHRDVKHSFSAQNAATAFAKATPIAFLRPMIGATEALSKTLQGIYNQMDQDNLVNMKDKYKQSGPKAEKPAKQ